MVATPPRDVQTVPIATDTWVLRSRSWQRLRFEMEYALERGTTANSYLIYGDKITLMDPPGETFTELFLTELQRHVALDQITYVILGHINPNRVATLARLWQLAPQVTFVCSNPGDQTLRSLLAQRLPELTAQRPPQTLVIRGEETLDIGRGHVLELIPIPTPRFPNGLATFDPSTGLLFCGKFFSAHRCSDQVFDEGWEALQEDYRYYFDCIHAPQVRQVEQVLERLGRWRATCYANGHGSLVRYHVPELTYLYRLWCERQSGYDLTVALLYASAYGNTATLAQAMGRGLTKGGVRVESLNCEFASPEEIRQVVSQAQGIILGSPTLGGHAPTQMQTALGIVLEQAPRTVLVGVFGSYGWSGEAVDLLAGRLRDAGFPFGFEPIRVKFAPTDADLQRCEQTGTDFAQALRQKQRRQVARPTDAQAARAEQAMGRIVGPLCVLAARRGELTSGMLASWVSQATFNPPGITVAVAKDRAVESLLHVGDRFVLNILPEGSTLPRHFLKPFAPGEDRFAGVATTTTADGCPILTDALAYLHCQVAQRMECGDHWVIYAVVDEGKVLNPSGITAVHHRKSGNHY
ncbi:MAG: diflavin flavoprotein [Gloeomargarita sp. SKYG116]|nr:diflavin flavoprotein [Gloeomargarita sp. SKYG116]MDW8401524.1 diflavin flavoprotein [Gloeomargarita sp. SKYGB_i_bin116]